MRSSLSVFLLILFFVIPCAWSKSPVIKATWKNPAVSAEDLRVKKLLVIGIVADPDTRTKGEDQLVKFIQSLPRAQSGELTVTASHSILDRDQMISADTMKGKVADGGFDAALLLRLVGPEQKHSWHPGDLSAPFDTLWGYNAYGWSNIYAPKNKKYNESLLIETLLYSTSDGKLMWGAFSESFKPHDLDKFLSEIEQAVTAELAKQGLIQGNQQ